jgi:transmembrane sensor
MSDVTKRLSSEADIEAALLWYAALQDIDASEETWQGFTQWLEARTEHRLAFERVEDLHATLHSNAPNILALLPAAEDFGSTSANDNRGWWSGKAAFGVAAALVVAGLISLWHPRKTPADMQPTVYEAAPGQSRALSLADGSHLDLSPGSRIEIRYDARSRSLLLDRGEILVHVGHDPRRPLMLLAGDLIIRDVGTVFDVALRRAQIAVTVVSGQVAVATGGQAAAGETPVQLSAGQQILHTPGAATSPVSHVDPATVLSWQNGFLTYHDASVSDVVADINVRFAAHVQVADAATGARRFSGALKAESLDATLRRLSVLLGLPVIHRGDGEQLGASNTLR